MSDGTGWTIEMQLKVARGGPKVVEVPVDYRPRLGRSKLSGTRRGSAGTRIGFSECRGVVA